MHARTVPRTKYTCDVCMVSGIVLQIVWFMICAWRAFSIRIAIRHEAKSKQFGREVVTRTIFSFSKDNTLQRCVRCLRWQRFLHNNAALFGLKHLNWTWHDPYVNIHVKMLWRTCSTRIGKISRQVFGVFSPAIRKWRWWTRQMRRVEEKTTRKQCGIENRKCRLYLFAYWTQSNRIQNNG